MGGNPSSDAHAGPGESSGIQKGDFRFLEQMTDGFLVVKHNESISDHSTYVVQSRKRIIAGIGPQG